MRVDSTCKVKGCDKKVAVKGMCSKHYQRWRKYGDATFIRTSQSSSKVICKVESCNEISLEGIPLCKTHLEKLKGADMIHFFKEGLRVCEVEDCNLGHQAKGYCHKHYQQYKKGTLGEGLQQPTEPVTMKDGERICNVEGCEQLHQARGYCPKHYQAYRYKEKGVRS